MSILQTAHSDIYFHDLSYFLNKSLKISICVEPKVEFPGGLKFKFRNN